MGFFPSKKKQIEFKIAGLKADIIKLKSMNRHIGDKIRSYQATINANNAKCTRFYIDGNGDLAYVYKDRVNRDLQTVEYFRLLQTYNSHVITMHRASIKELEQAIVKHEILARMTSAITAETTQMPSGLTREEKRKVILNVATKGSTDEQ